MTAGSFLLPNLILVGLFLIVPLIGTIIISFQKLASLGPAQFLGKPHGRDGWYINIQHAILRRNRPRLLHLDAPFAEPMFEVIRGDRSTCLVAGIRNSLC